MPRRAELSLTRLLWNHKRLKGKFRCRGGSPRGFPAPCASGRYALFTVVYPDGKATVHRYDLQSFEIVNLSKRYRNRAEAQTAIGILRTLF